MKVLCVTRPWLAASVAFIGLLCVLSCLPVTIANVEEEDVALSKEMMWVSASNPSALCNDFTRAGFFIRRNPSSKNWIVFLESGGLCYNATTCNRRFFVSNVSSIACIKTPMIS